ncbi:MAG TPA: DUF1573 domain-containing protein [Prolixibacteraceae bacterium]|nr:DUF1573 domain-containing protein [Prolixibacteraceae bacterium]
MRTGLKFQVPGFKFQVAVVLMWAMLLGSSCNPGAKKAPESQSVQSGAAKFVFSEEIHNFGSLKAGEVVAYTFTFKNEGTGPLIINNVDTGCGCTEVKLPGQPVEPGQEGYIEVTYDSSGETGRQLKTIILFSNAEQAEQKLYIKADVSNEIIEINS